MNPNGHADYLRQAEQHFSAGTPPNARPIGGTTSNAEHQNIALLPGEDSVFAGDFTPSPLLRHIKTGLVVTGERVIVRHPQYLLFVIRVGHTESSTPLRHVSSTTVGRQLSQRRVLSAAVAGFVGFTMLTSSFGMMGMGPLGPLLLLVAFGLLGFAAFQLWMARGLALIVTHSGGGALRVDVDKVEYPHMLEAESVIQQLLSTPTPAPAPRASSPISPSREAPAPPAQQPFATRTRPPAQPTPPAQYPRPVTPPSIWRG
ncbi:hypothetical protein [Mycolicibacterium monacense]|uniref:Transmembrane protein n=2 Tax=Mycobacteriaceae TaxID=1762 RepID=A0AAD1IXZ1_MYCMB|nr:hypothetical protein [Mycolicibacterium monacense]MDA4100359.1 hypothetical protein [Mycolicibacterium monacense DSM 44395]ORB22482.1 hypothetical protein BST34_07530 [Mycolicibacterium monacense DSM 44395]QHP84641.1 hypothetical protein EWR22_04220 [Mycolicibacterium monacense DSM 44395]BBZ62583.1 hypothetical protein MMON_38840 [Mycolicibacterium monacense]